MNYLEEQLAKYKGPNTTTTKKSNTDIMVVGGSFIMAAVIIYQFKPQIILKENGEVCYLRLGSLSLAFALAVYFFLFRMK